MPAFLTRAALKNYKSIASCDVELGPLVFLAGPSGAGKSNFLDALSFVAGALRTSLDHALRERGGIAEVRRRSAGHPNHFAIRLDFALPGGGEGSYSFEVGARPHGRHEVEREECRVRGPAAFDTAEFAVERGRVIAGAGGPDAAPDCLYLPACGLPQFRPVLEALRAMAFYNLDPASIRELQPPDAGRLLAPDGSNLAAVIGQLPEEARQNVEAWLKKMVPGLEGVNARALGPKEMVEFRQNGWHFPAAGMSEGTLRALGVLVALFQPALPLVAVEQPEMALHPAAAALMRDALREAGSRGQVLATSHSAELLEAAGPETVLAVYMVAGNTRVAPLEGETRGALRDHLYLAPELLRAPAGGESEEPAADQLGLFEPGGKVEEPPPTLD